MKLFLLLDVFITDTPLFRNEKLEALTRQTHKTNISTYIPRNRMDITLYTLASYSVINFDYITIFYEVDDCFKDFPFEEKVIDLFPSARLINKRSSTGLDFEALRDAVIQSDANYVYYCPNNDHPFISKVELLNKYLSKLDKLEFENKSLIYSHAQETIFATSRGTWSQLETFKKMEVLDETEECKVVSLPKGYSVGMQIASRSLFLNWCDQAISLGSSPIKRLDELAGHTKLPRQITIVPKIELCRHFDGYHHTTLNWPRLKYSNLPANIVPPLFIPNGFFESKIRVRVGSKIYDKDYVNINDIASRYAFEVESEFVDCVDIKGNISAVPEFWLPRISEMVVEQNVEFTCYTGDNAHVNGITHLNKLSRFDNSRIIFLRFINRSARLLIRYILKRVL